MFEKFWSNEGHYKYTINYNRSHKKTKTFDSENSPPQNTNYSMRKIYIYVADCGRLQGLRHESQLPDVHASVAPSCWVRAGLMTFFWPTGQGSGVILFGCFLTGLEEIAAMTLVATLEKATWQGSAVAQGAEGSLWQTPIPQSCSHRKHVLPTAWREPEARSQASAGIWLAQPGETSRQRTHKSPRLLTDRNCRVIKCALF